VIDNKLLLLRDELSKSIVAFEKMADGDFEIYFNDCSCYSEFKDNLNHLYYEFIKEVQGNLLKIDSEKGIHIYLEMLMHLFELLDEQIGTYPDFVTPHRKTKMVSRINTKVSCIHTNPDDLNQLLIYFQHQKKITRKSIKFIQVFKEKCSNELPNDHSNTLTWKDELKEFYPEMTRIKNELNQIGSIPDRIDFLHKERDRLNLEYQKKNKQLYSSPINFFFESRIECLKDVLIWMNGKQTDQSKVEKTDNQEIDDRRVKYSEGFKWTESKASLVELIYALYYNPKALHIGKNSIKELAKIFEQLFDIDLGDVYHIYYELKSRKLEPAKFIDSLKSSFLKKIEEENEL